MSRVPRPRALIGRRLTGSRRIRSTPKSTPSHRPKKEDLPSTLPRFAPMAPALKLTSRPPNATAVRRAHRVAYADLRHSFEKIGGPWDTKGTKAPPTTMPSAVELPTCNLSTRSSNTTPRRRCNRLGETPRWAAAIGWTVRARLPSCGKRHSAAGRLRSLGVWWQQRRGNRALARALRDRQG